MHYCYKPVFNYHNPAKDQRFEVCDYLQSSKAQEIWIKEGPGKSATSSQRSEDKFKAKYAWLQSQWTRERIGLNLTGPKYHCIEDQY